MECHSVDWFFNRTTDSNKIDVIVLDDQKSRELRRIRTTGLAVVYIRVWQIPLFPDLVASAK